MHKQQSFWRHFKYVCGGMESQSPDRIKNFFRSLDDDIF